MQSFSITQIIKQHDDSTLCDFLAARTSLSKSKIKDAMLKGAVWLRKPRKKMIRVRRATKTLAIGDEVAIHYDENILSVNVTPPVLMADVRQYSVWDKPAGMLAQGTKFGDHNSLLRQAELHFQAARSQRRECFLVHRLDREAAGLMLVAHTTQAAGALSRLFHDNRLHKQYCVIVDGGFLAAHAPQGTIDFPLDNKHAITHYCVNRIVENKCVIDVNIATGRKHQIRRHFAQLGFPVLGDPRYGTQNAHPGRLCLIATQLTFDCPVNKKPVVYRLDHADERIGALLNSGCT